MKSSFSDLNWKKNDTVEKNVHKARTFCLCVIFPCLQAQIAEHKIHLKICIGLQMLLKKNHCMRLRQNLTVWSRLQVRKSVKFKLDDCSQKRHLQYRGASLKLEMEIVAKLCTHRHHKHLIAKLYPVQHF